MPRRSSPFARLAGEIGPPTLEGFEDEGLVGLNDSGQRSRLVRRRRAEKPVTPAKGRRRMNATKLCGLRQASAFDHRSGMVEPALPFAQPPHRRFGQRIEGAPASLAAEPRESVRPSPGDDVPSRAMRTAPAFHSLMARGSKRVRARASGRRLGLRSVQRRSPFRPVRPSAILPALKLRQSSQDLKPLSRAQLDDPGKPSRKVLSPHRITPNPTFTASLIQTN